MNIIERLLNIDRRWIFLVVAIGALLPIIFPIRLPIAKTQPVKNIFDGVEKLRAGDTIILSFDYGPSSAPENDPQAEAVLRHAFKRGIRVVVVALYPIGGLTMAINVLDKVTSEFKLEYGKDFVNLGYKDGGQALMKQMGADIHSVFPVDNKGTKIAEIELMRDVHNYRDIKLVVSLATGIIGEWWANLVNAQFGVPVAVGCTAVSAPKYYAYLKAGQMMGLMGGLKGAAEYEAMIVKQYPEFEKTYSKPGSYTASRGMSVQAVVHLLIIGFIVLGNISFLIDKRRKSRGGK